MHLHHLGIACKDISKAVEQFISLHPDATEITPITFDPKQDATLQLFRLPDGTGIEFVSGKAVKGRLNRGESLYHICYQTNKLESQIETLVGSGAFLISPPTPAILFKNKKVAFLQTSYGLIELLEE